MWYGPIFPAENGCLDSWNNNKFLLAERIGQHRLPKQPIHQLDNAFPNVKREKLDQATLSDENKKGDAKKTNKVRVGTLD